MTSNTTNKSKTSDIALYGLFIALIYVATRFINIPGPTPGGLFHLGNVMAFTIAIVFGKRAGAISAAFGMALFDITSSFLPWAPFTFIIRFAMGYTIGYLSDKGTNGKASKSLFFNLLGIALATIIMIGGYYIAEVILYGNLYAPIQSIWGNFMQCVVGTVLGLPLATAVKSAFIKRNLLTRA
ncbi:ECF transporter S component [Clostridium sp. YIM B02551]|uniref:ECF transporter S component n=1 Tax=Clostridium sp. YIM B02551 TaxID=2910679 RepID=UPI001EEC672A|nr:ECF transporter S component [Clostridium sp. YIM B02551]